jgi:hypothetical protein
VVVERRADRWGEKSPEGENPRSDLARNGWKARRGARRQERSELWRRNVPGVGPSAFKSFELVIAVGTETP